jgi:hypothetical protein
VLAVGDRGVVVLLDGHDSLQSTTHIGDLALRGVTFSGLDAFIVGAGGTIIHGMAEGVTIPERVPL